MKNVNRMKRTWSWSSSKTKVATIFLLVLLSAAAILLGRIPARADDCDSAKAAASIPGQIAAQLDEALALSRTQAFRIAQLAGEVEAAFTDWRPRQLERRQALAESYAAARADGRIGLRERAELKKLKQQWRQGRREMLEVIASAVVEIDDLLTEKQKEALEELRFELSLPDEVAAALEDFREELALARAEFNENGSLSETTRESLEESWQSLKEALYLPEALAANLDGRIWRALIARLEESGGRPRSDAAAFNLDPEKLQETLAGFLEKSEGEDFSLQELLDCGAGLGPAGGRLALFYRYARSSLLEAFMLTPIFNCHLQ